MLTKSQQRKYYALKSLGTRHMKVKMLVFFMFLIEELEREPSGFLNNVLPKELISRISKKSLGYSYPALGEILAFIGFNDEAVSKFGQMEVLERVTKVASTPDMTINQFEEGVSEFLYQVTGEKNNLQLETHFKAICWKDGNRHFSPGGNLFDRYTGGTTMAFVTDFVAKHG
jgi:hypothetical protein